MNEPVQKYRTGSAWDDRIQVVELIKETAKQVVVREKTASGKFVDARYSKESRHFRLHDTWSDARQHLVERLGARRASLIDQLADIDERLKSLAGGGSAMLQ